MRVRFPDGSEPEGLPPSSSAMIVFVRRHRSDGSCRAPGSSGEPGHEQDAREVSDGGAVRQAVPDFQRRGPAERSSRLTAVGPRWRRPAAPIADKQRQRPGEIEGDRARYGEEYTALLEELPAAGRVALDVLSLAVRLRLRQASASLHLASGDPGVTDPFLREGDPHARSSGGPRPAAGDAQLHLPVLRTAQVQARVPRAVRCHR
jgi:hypothetical protein